MKTEISGRMGKRSALEAVAKAREPELVADALPVTLDLCSWGRARSTLRMRHIRAAIENAEFLTRAYSLVNADDGDGKGMLAALTDLERMQVISLVTEVCAAQKLKK